MSRARRRANRRSQRLATALHLRQQQLERESRAQHREVLDAMPAPPGCQHPHRGPAWQLYIGSPVAFEICEDCGDVFTTRIPTLEIRTRIGRLVEHVRR